MTTNSSGANIQNVKYVPFGGARSDTVSTDKKFTGQRLDGTGWYYYNARYHDPAIGRFVSADTVTQSYENPQALNRYTDALNNSLRYINPSGHRAVEDTPTYTVTIV
jgi:RHS repeat-associated protein